MSIFTVKPLDDRTGFKGNSKQSPFDSSWSSTLQLLERELRRVGATNVIAEIDTLPGAIRLDGQLYANARVNSPAVRLHFDSKHGHINQQTDAFSTWQDNVRAIALGLEALRKIERYELGRGDEQYHGYLALEAGGGIALGGMTKSEALDVLTLHCGWEVIDDPAILARAHRRVRANTHPDANDGNQADWDRVELAAKTLGLS